MAVDGKYGRVTTENGTIGENEPVMVFRAQDALLPEVITHYLKLCEAAGSPQRHLDLVRAALSTVIRWQEANYTQIPRSEGSV